MRQYESFSKSPTNSTFHPSPWSGQCIPFTLENPSQCMNSSKRIRKRSSLYSHCYGGHRGWIWAHIFCASRAYHLNGDWMESLFLSFHWKKSWLSSQQKEYFYYYFLKLALENAPIDKRFKGSLEIPARLILSFETHFKKAHEMVKRFLPPMERICSLEGFLIFNNLNRLV